MDLTMLSLACANLKILLDDRVLRSLLPGLDFCVQVNGDLIQVVTEQEWW